MTRSHTPADFARSVTFDARHAVKTSRAHGPAVRAMVEAIDQAYFETAKAQMKGRTELAHEFAALSYDGMCQLKRLLEN